MKAKLLLLIFVLAASAWCLIVITFATQRGTTIPPYLDAPWAGIALGTLGGFLIGALGLRVFYGATQKEFIKRLAKLEPILTVSGNDPLVACQTMYRQPYTGYSAGRVKVSL